MSRTFYAVMFAAAVAVGVLGTMRWKREADTCRAELAAVRDSLRVERADLIACYQGRTPKPDSLDWSKLDTYQIFGRGVRRDSFSGDTVRAIRVVVWP